ncbi:hypothetical protein V493_02301 [Pseudogymnoascus sp. VKM F-4281 (FW-2241)]|nr:hypothetical protein V493_02301 [Pseudogymnoascus sp. VKM F-4281 (FW-2241)]
MLQQYQHSTEVDSATLARSGSFTTLPVRIHRNDVQVQKASNQFIREWKRIVGDKRFDLTVSQSPVGHAASLMFPECLPERLAFIAKACDFVTAVDDATDLPTSQEASKIFTPHGQILLMQFSRIYHAEKPSPRSQHAHPKENNGTIVLDTGGFRLDFFWKELRLCTSLEDYIPLRLVNGAFTVMKGSVCLAMNLGLDTQERAAVYHVIRPLEVAMALTNDYFSYHKEKALHSLHNVPGDIFNAVPIIMAQHGILEDDALALLKQKIIEAEEDHRGKAEELGQRGQLTPELKQYVMACRLGAGGCHFWHASAPRYEIPTGWPSCLNKVMLRRSKFRVHSAEDKAAIGANKIINAIVIVFMYLEPWDDLPIGANIVPFA